MGVGMLFVFNICLLLCLSSCGDKGVGKGGDGYAGVDEDPKEKPKKDTEEDKGNSTNVEETGGKKDSNEGGSNGTNTGDEEGESDTPAPEERVHKLSFEHRLKEGSKYITLMDNEELLESQKSSNTRTFRQNVEIRLSNIDDLDYDSMEYMTILHKKEGQEKELIKKANNNLSKNKFMEDLKYPLLENGEYYLGVKHKGKANDRYIHLLDIDKKSIANLEVIEYNGDIVKRLPEMVMADHVKINLFGNITSFERFKEIEATVDGKKAIGMDPSEESGNIPLENTKVSTGAELEIEKSKLVVRAKEHFVSEGGDEITNQDIMVGRPTVLLKGDKGQEIDLSLFSELFVNKDNFDKIVFIFPFLPTKFEVKGYLGNHYATFIKSGERGSAIDISEPQQLREGNNILKKYGSQPQLEKIILGDYNYPYRYIKNVENLPQFNVKVNSKGIKISDIGDTIDVEYGDKIIFESTGGMISKVVEMALFKKNKLENKSERVQTNKFAEINIEESNFCNRMFLYVHYTSPSRTAGRIIDVNFRVKE